MVHSKWAAADQSDCDGQNADSMLEQYRGDTLGLGRGQNQSMWGKADTGTTYQNLLMRRNLSVLKILSLNF